MFKINKKHKTIRKCMIKTIDEIEKLIHIISSSKYTTEKQKDEKYRELLLNIEDLKQNISTEEKKVIQQFRL